MPDATGITIFDYHPPTEDSEATWKVHKIRRLSRMMAPPLSLKTPLLFPRRSLDIFFLVQIFIIYLYIPNLIEEKFYLVPFLLCYSCFFPLKITTMTFDEFREYPLILELEFLAFEEQFSILKHLENFSVFGSRFRGRIQDLVSDWPIRSRFSLLDEVQVDY